MAEPRKVPFVTISSYSPSAPADLKRRRREDEAEITSLGKDGGAGSKDGGAGGKEVGGSGRRDGGAGSGAFGNVKGGEGDAAETRQTVRLDLPLSEPSDRGSAEFNYSELVQSTLPRDKVKKNPSGPPKGLAPPLDPSDPFADDDKERQEVEALSKKFESKYGNPGKRKRRDRMQDLVDIGYGYDDTDPFIDNSEAYDELVPASLTTRLGGFYINTGTLQFRAASDSEGEEPGPREPSHYKKMKPCEERGMMKKKRKKPDGANMEDKKPYKNRLPKPGGVSVLGMLRPQQKKRKKLMKDSLNLANMLRRFSREKDQMRRRTPTGPAPPPHGPAPQARSHSNNLVMGDLTADPSMMSLLGSANNNEMLQDMMGDLDFSLLDSSPQPASPTHGENGTQGGGPRGGASGPGRVLAPPPLPGGLPAPLAKRIEDLRTASRQFDQEGRKKFFTLDMNNILLDIELQVQEQPAGVRAAVYSHLEAFVPCNKEALLKRLKKLSLNIQDDRLRSPLLKLKLAVCSVMPEQIARYNMDCIAKVAKQQSEEGEKNGSEEDDEEKPGKRVMGPRKKFVWDDKLRSLLCSLVRVKLGCYELEGHSSLSVEDYLKTFMEAEVKPLWPKGWMQARILFKESLMVHAHLTGNAAKKKIVPIPKVKPKDGIWVQQRPSPQPGAPLLSSSCSTPPVSRQPPLSPPSSPPSGPPSPLPLDPISQALALLSTAAKGLVHPEPAPPSEPPVIPRGSPLLLQQHRQYVSSPSASPLAAAGKGGAGPVQGHRSSVLSSQPRKTATPPASAAPKPRPPPTSSPLNPPGARPPGPPPTLKASSNTNNNHHSSPPPRPSLSHLPPRLPQPSPLTVGGAGFVTPMQATLTRPTHSSTTPIVKLTPSSSSPSSSSPHTRPQTVPSMHQYSSKSPVGYRPAFPAAPGQKAPSQTNASLTNSSPIIKQHPGAGPAPVVAPAANQGQRQRSVGGTTQGAKPITSVSPSPASPQLPQVTAAGGVSLLSPSPSLPRGGFGLLGGLVPVSLASFPFPPLLNMPPSSQAIGGVSTTASQTTAFSTTTASQAAAFSTLTQNLYKSLQSGGQVTLPPHLQLAFSELSSASCPDVSQTPSGDKRKSL